MSIKVAPNANLLSVAKDIRKVFPAIEQQLPQGLDGRIVYDATDYVNSSIKEVVITLLEALFIVTLVIFLSLGSVRSVIIPTVAIPLSLVGAFLIMLALGYTINLMTLLALVLAIGLVVDDAIIVVENVHRHMEEGVPPLQAAIMGARELGRADYRHDGGADCRVFAHRIYGRPHRRAFYRVCLYAGRRRVRVGRHCADAFAHDVLALSESTRPG